jgi:hypothetical protein
VSEPTGSDAFDVVVIGGGIHGAGVLQAVAAGGYSGLLLEERTLAAGTSSRSSKLVHGGLRYLETFQLGLVRESLEERETLLRIAPGLVRLVPFHIPVYRDSMRRPWKIRAGLSLYALLIWRGLHILTVAKNLYGALLAGGITVMLLFQIFVNVGMTVGIMPITGVPAPLLSFGGSSMLVTFLAIGLLHTPLGRPLLARLGVGCPVQASPEEVERARLKSAHATSGSEASPADCAS